MPWSNDRLWDDSIFIPPGQPRSAPQFVLSLVTQLQLARASQADKDRAIADWLTENDPSPNLSEDLEAKGYGHLIRRRPDDA